MLHALRRPLLPLAVLALPLAGDPVSYRTGLPEPPELTPDKTAGDLAHDKPAAEAVKVVPQPTTLADLDRDDAARLQILLDEAGFGPGVIDGRPGQFTRLALDAWNEFHGLPSDDLARALRAARAKLPQPYGLSFVPEAATEWVDPALPGDRNRSAQAKRKRMSYRSFAEFMAERYHTDVQFLTELNTPETITSLAPRDSLLVPNVTAFRIEALTGARYEEDETLSQRHLVIDTRIHQMRIYRAAPQALVVSEEGMALPVANRALIASFPITRGRSKFVKLGHFKMVNCLEFPHWRYDQQLLDTGRRSDNALVIPPGPNSPVGILWAGLSKPGIGLHGTSSPHTIGRSRSAGCIRLSNWNAARLPTLVRPGVTVEIR
jgi:lipoprotein-anchoring transpeptidase ErfK/SrfK